MIRINQPGDIHFVTFVTNIRRPIFKDEDCCKILLEEFDFYRQKYGLKIYGYVILPDHVHCLIYFEDEKLTISKIMQGIKGAAARRIIDLYASSGRQEHLLLSQADPGAEPMLRSTRRGMGLTEQMLRAIPRDQTPHKRNLQYRLWQSKFYDFNVYSDKKFQEKLDYIHKNPYKHGIVKDLSEYKYSSLRNYELNDQSIFQIDYREN
ncbi:MAG: transposase [Candidatus Parcubacteria bacterium]|nr:transposase [Candidatus Parcubacteria bacterium]